MALAEDIAQSRDYEMGVYLRSTRAMYDNAVTQNAEIYDIAFELTRGFSTITAGAILEDSRIIKVLRYAVAPTISQMKFGQLFGRKSVVEFERDRIPPQTAKHRELAGFAPKIAEFAVANLDRTRFVWLEERDIDLALARRYAKNWTCSLAADQNAQTAYRNWRKAQQEHAIISQLISLGYVKSGFAGVIGKPSDINIGEYTQEIKVRGRTVQKADIAFRSKRSKKLVLIEAKAVGVELDATKRIKECCDKANDWASPRLCSPVVVSVIAGFFTRVNTANLEASGVRLIWEHRLSDLGGFA